MQSNNQRSVSWRNRLPSVLLKEMDDILQALEENGQDRLHYVQNIG